MADIPYFPRKLITWDIVSSQEDLPSTLTLEALITTLTQINEYVPNTTEIAITYFTMYLSPNYSEFSATFEADCLETDKEYLARFVKAQKKFIDAGLTDKFMRSTLTKVDKALDKLGHH